MIGGLFCLFVFLVCFGMTPGQQRLYKIGCVPKIPIDFGPGANSLALASFQHRPVCGSINNRPRQRLGIGAGTFPWASHGAGTSQRKMNTKLSVSDCKNGYSFFTNVKLVRGVGRKTVRVIICPAHGRNGYEDEAKLAIDAAKLAAKKGWRKIVVAPDSYEGDTIRGFNLHQYHHEEWQRGLIGAFLGFISR